MNNELIVLLAYMYMILYKNIDDYRPDEWSYIHNLIKAMWKLKLTE